MCERVWRNTQVCAKLQGLTIGTCGWLAAGKLLDDVHEWSMQRRWTITPAGALQDKKSNLAILFARNLNSRLSQVARPSRQPALFWKTRLFAFHYHSSINTPYTHEILRASRENIERETLEKNKIDSSTIFTCWFFKFLNSHPLYCYILERFISQNFSHHTHICKKAFWCFGKQLGMDQFTLVDAMAYRGIR